MNILIENALVLPMTSAKNEPQYYRGSVGVCGKHIAFAGSDSREKEEFKKSCGDDIRIIDGREMLVMPGLINTHNHTSMTLMRGYADDIPLMPWLYDHIWPFEAKLDRDDVLVGAELGIAEMLLSGTTTFVDMYWHEEAVGEAVEKTGIRAVLTPTFTDTCVDDFLKDFNTVVQRYGNGQCDRITLMVAPHSPYTCSVENLKMAFELAEKHNVGINIHVAETIDEVNIIKERYNKTPIEHICDLGILNSKSLAVHSVHLSDSDIELLHKSGASAVHNPQSNMKLASGASPVVKMIKAGINVSIGTDGPCSNNDLDLWDEMRSASFFQKFTNNDSCVLPAYEIINMATVAGAKAIGLGNQLGQIKAGMLADLVLIDTMKPHLYPQYNMVANLVYSAKSTDVDTVIVNGEILVEKGKLNRFNERELCINMQNRVDEITSRK